MATYTQTNRRLSLDTPLGKDVLLLTGFTGREEVSRLFRFELDMLSTNDAVDPTDLVGKGVTWSVQGPESEPRYFHGVVSRFAAAGVNLQGLRQYRAEVVPWLWLLTCTRDCRIYQNKTVPQIVEAVFQDLSQTDFDAAQIKGTHNAREYCVQYRESDFDFVSRLLEQEGIFYFFRHEQGKHTLVLADQKGAYQDCAEKEVEYFQGDADFNRVSRWEHRFEFRPGKWTQNDYNFETPSTNLKSSSTTVLPLKGTDKYERYDYPGGYAKTSDGGALTDLRMEEEEAAYEVVDGASTCRSFSPGGKFTLQKHDCKSEEGKAYALTAVEHEASEPGYVAGVEPGQDYRNAFTCIPATVVYRPGRTTPRPVVSGPQTAVVVGPSGEEIYTDKYGRVKVQFFWDRLGKKDENSSCWVRVAEGWAGKTWGTLFLPRVGQEVVVEFLEGDPDRPLVTGRLYNAEQMPPYTLPANQTQSGIKTRSSKQGSTDNCNELRFEDKKGSEQVYFHAEKDFVREVENDDKLTVSHDQTITVKNDRTETVQEGNESVTVSKGNRTTTISQGNESLEVKQGNRTVTLGQGNNTLELKQGNRSVILDMGGDTLTIKQGNQTTKLNMGASVTDAMQSIELKVGQSSIKIDQSGVTIAGLMVKVQAQTQAQVSGLNVQVQGTAMASVKGAITNIG